MACGGHTLQGSIDVIESLPLKDANSTGAACTGLGGYSDINAGTSVVVRDQSGKVLATGSLDAGKIVSLETCEFAFSVQSVPDADFYQVEVSRRGNMTYSKSDLDKRNWKVSLSLGS
jgi:hypothetical protein